MTINQILIKYGWIAIIILIVLTFIVSNIHMNNKIKREITSFMSDSNENNSEDIISRKDLEILPEPVENWLLNIGVVGQKKIQYVKLSQRGNMKLKPEQKAWTQSSAKQYIRVDKPGYLWDANISVIPILNTKGRDLFKEGIGKMEIRIGGLIPVANVEDNNKINESSHHRFLLELPWYPTAALEKYMKWEKIDKNKAKAIMSYLETEVEAIFHFENNNIVKVESLRYKETSGEAQRIPCIGEIEDYTKVEGLKIANRVNVTWVIEDKPFTWYELENYDIELIRY